MADDWDHGADDDLAGCAGILLAAILGAVAFALGFGLVAWFQ